MHKLLEPEFNQFLLRVPVVRYFEFMVNIYIDSKLLQTSTISACLYGYVHVELLPRYESYWDWFNFKNLKSNSKEEKVNLVGQQRSHNDMKRRINHHLPQVNQAWLQRVPNHEIVIVAGSLCLGKEKAVYENVEEWGLDSDTTASNTGRLNGACNLME
ncbi:hypothetical protein FF38_03594 [Lucilia cuprina]|uniref:Uncharacterized protein n=1 Tax=Lucilia cuprina TaxID=7375 RepID=A0A0L0BSI7_LUCCU|nr:hypothetical protein FF38_03594 [Lucilia cuprina]